MRILKLTDFQIVQRAICEIATKFATFHYVQNQFSAIQTSFFHSFLL
jgi:hypothetical protein